MLTHVAPSSALNLMLLYIHIMHWQYLGLNLGKCFVLKNKSLCSLDYAALRIDVQAVGMRSVALHTP